MLKEYISVLLLKNVAVTTTANLCTFKNTFLIPKGKLKCCMEENEWKLGEKKSELHKISF